MKKIKIAHLYYDIMNLYGENANIKALTNALDYQNVSYDVHFLSIDNDINLDDYDFIYMGSGTEESELIVREHIIKYKKTFKKAIGENKFMLITGNAFELFGKTIVDIDGNTYDALGIFNFKSIDKGFRIISDQVYETDLIKEKIIGFQNHQNVIEGIDANLFKVLAGNGYDPNAKTEGIHINNFYGTYLVGPILIRNPFFLEYIIKQLLNDKGFEYKEVKENIFYQSYYKFLENFYDEEEQKIN